MDSATQTELKLNYSSLSDPIPGQHEISNIFGTIINIKEPYFNKGRINQWMMSVKLVDQSLNQKATNQIKIMNSKRSIQNGGEIIMRNINHAVIQFFASEKYNLPNVLRIGDILRVQRCQCREH
jgi:hypothetical protein